MAPSSSSTKKAARLAQKGKGQKVRFQGGTLFPMVVALVLIAGLALVVYARQSRPAFGDSPPTVNDHWHHAYGFYLCDTWYELQGDGEAQDANGRPTNIEYARTGVHSHEDGLIHWHPFTSLAVGNRARLGVFLNTFDVDLTNDRLEFPEDQRAFLPNHQETGVFENGETQCEITDADGNVSMEDGELKAVIWDNISNTGDGRTLIADFDNIRLDQDAMVVAIAFVPDDADVTMPPSVQQFDQNVQNDSGQLPPDDLFSGVNVEEDGDVTVGSEPLDPAEVGPAVTQVDDAGDDSATTDPAAGDTSGEPSSGETSSSEPSTTDS